MTWTIYIIQSEVTGKLYTGISNDPDKRLARHNAGRGAKFTRTGRPWKTIYREVAETKGEALRRERAIKKLRRAEKFRLAHQKHPSDPPRRSRSEGLPTCP